MEAYLRILLAGPVDLLYREAFSILVTYRVFGIREEHEDCDIWMKELNSRMFEARFPLS